MSGIIDVTVPLGERAYTVLIGHGARHELPAVIDALYPAAVSAKPQRAAIVTQQPIQAALSQTALPQAAPSQTAPSQTTPPGDPIAASLATAGIQTLTTHIPDGEDAKQLATIEDLCSQFSQFGMTRNDIVIGVGGGVVTDVAGFAASVYHRGIAVIHVATTLLGQIDAAIGGKTGVNLPQGKNLVGAFWQPKAVLCDTETLETLSPREYQSGLGELAKYHFLGGADLDELPIDERVAECVRIKAAAVTQDETESGSRALLNYGHTLAHALEISGKFDLRHGEAVAVGLYFAALLARQLGRIDDAAVEKHRCVLASYDLSHDLPANVNHDELIGLFRQDKKATNGFTFVLDGPNGLEVVPAVPEEILRKTLAEHAEPGNSATAKPGTL